MQAAELSSYKNYNTLIHTALSKTYTYAGHKVAIIFGKPKAAKKIKILLLDEAIEDLLLKHKAIDRKTKTP